jgi:ferredoxin
MNHKEGAMLDVYAKLRERLDMFPQGFPKTKSGVELEVLQYLFSPDEAEIMLFLRPTPESVSVIAKRMKRDEVELGDTLYEMSKRGLIMRSKASEEQIFYFLAPWMVGIWEFQVNNLNKENIQLYERYFREGIVEDRRETKTPRMRVIPIEKEIQGTTVIQHYEKVSEIIEAHTRFAVAECICRKENRIMGDGCDKLLEVCMMFGSAADYYIENELGREITKVFICNCCGCCCKVLGYITKYDVPAVMAKSNYYAAVDEETCSACETCVDRCQVSAIQVENGHAVMHQDRCIGCGLCVSTCPTESISMVHKRPEEATVIFVDQTELIEAIGKEKNKEYPFE